MKSLSLENVTVLGLLSHRLLRSSMRLESDIYPGQGLPARQRRVAGGRGGPHAAGADPADGSHQTGALLFKRNPAHRVWKFE